MDSNIITNPSQGSVKLSKLSHLTNEQLLRQMEIDRIEERISPYIIDMSKQLPDEQPLISIDGIADLQRNTNDLERAMHL